MFSLLLAAAGASLAAGDVSYADLGYAKPGTGGDACIARFDNGAIARCNPVRAAEKCVGVPIE